MHFLAKKVIDDNHFKSSLMKLLCLMALGNPANQVFILKRLVQKKRFRKRLYLDPETSTKKIEMVIALKKKIAYLT
jgi:hypothetical protein